MSAGGNNRVLRLATGENRLKKVRVFLQRGNFPGSKKTENLVWNFMSKLLCNLFAHKRFGWRSKSDRFSIFVPFFAQCRYCPLPPTEAGWQTQHKNWYGYGTGIDNRPREIIDTLWI